MQQITVVRLDRLAKNQKQPTALLPVRKVCDGSAFRQLPLLLKGASVDVACMKCLTA
jgi:hypothetical protein